MKNANEVSKYPTDEAGLRSDPVYGPILFPPEKGGTIDLDQLAKEISDLRRVHDVGDHVVRQYTRGILSGITRMGGSIYTEQGIDDAAQMAEDEDRESREEDAATYEPVNVWRETEKAPSGFPRRNSVDQFVPAEKAIREAMAVVEAAGAHPLLTKAVCLLSDAQAAVADWVEQIPAGERPASAMPAK